MCSLVCLFVVRCPFVYNGCFVCVFVLLFSCVLSVVRFCLLPVHHVLFSCFGRIQLLVFVVYVCGVHVVVVVFLCVY